MPVWFGRAAASAAGDARTITRCGTLRGFRQLRLTLELGFTKECVLKAFLDESRQYFSFLGLHL